MDPLTQSLILLVVEKGASTAIELIRSFEDKEITEEDINNLREGMTPLTEEDFK